LGRGAKDKLPLGSPYRFKTSYIRKIPGEFLTNGAVLAITVGTEYLGFLEEIYPGERVFKRGWWEIFPPKWPGVLLPGRGIGVLGLPI